jgi:hypothetical protein
MRVPTIKVLRAARRTISRKSRWCRYVGAETRDGATTLCESPEAVRWCALGAIGKAAADLKVFDRKKVDPFTKEDVYLGQSALIQSLNLISRRLFPFSSKLQNVNDRIGREAALAVLDAAIAELSSWSLCETGRTDSSKPNRSNHP